MKLLTPRQKIHWKVPGKSDSRGGSVLLDSMFAGAILTSAITIALSVLHATHGQERAAERSQLALIELENQLELLSVSSLADLTPEKLQKVKLSDNTAARLPDGELTVTVERIETPLPGLRLTGSIRWQDRGNEWRTPIRLSTWVFESTESP